jgi:hypothetical protein
MGKAALAHPAGAFRFARPRLSGRGRSQTLNIEIQFEAAVSE